MFKKILKLSAIIMCIMLGIAGCGSKPKLAENTTVKVEMDDGSYFVIEVYPEFAPKTVANFVELVNSAIYAEDDKTISVYGEELVNRKVEFKSFCNQSDLDKEIEEGDYTSFDYYVNTTMLAIFSVGNEQGAVDFAFKCVFTGGYTENSALKILVEMSATKEGLGDKLANAYNSLESVDRYTFTNHSDFRSDMKELGYTLS